MKRTIAIGILGTLLLAGHTAAQTAAERDGVLREFNRRLVEYSQQHWDPLSGPILAAAPAPQVFTPPVAMVFRQLIAQALATHSGPAISGRVVAHRAVAMQRFPTNELTPVPKVLADALPVLPLHLEYRLVDNDLVIRDTAADVIIAVLREALGTLATRE